MNEFLIKTKSRKEVRLKDNQENKKLIEIRATQRIVHKII